jgi:hypothetical protein
MDINAAVLFNLILMVQTQRSFLQVESSIFPRGISILALVQFSFSSVTFCHLCIPFLSSMQPAIRKLFTCM